MYGLTSPHSPSCVFSAWILTGLWAWASVYGAVPAGEAVPTTITSKTMTARNKARQAIFEGMVVLKQGDLVVRSDVMIVQFKEDPVGAARTPEEASSRRRVETIEAKGKVIIEKPSGKATCGRAVYYKDKEIIVLTDSPVAWQRGTRVSGPKMTMYLKEDRSVVEGGSHVIFQDGE